MYFLAVNYHYVSDATHPHPGIHPVTPAALAAQLEELGRDFDFVSLGDVERHLDGNGSFPERACLVTLDDGLAEQHANAWPVLQRMKIPAAFFVNTAPCIDGTVSSVHRIHRLRAHTPPERFAAEIAQACRERGFEPEAVEPDPAVLAAQYRYDPPEAARLKYLLNFQIPAALREEVVADCFRARFDESRVAAELYMGVEQWRELADAGALGTHADHHVPLASLPPAQLRRDLERSVALLALHTGHRPTVVSYPYGGPTAVSREVAAAAAAVGLRVGLTMERAFNRSLADPLLLARADTHDVPGGRSPGFRMIDGVPRCEAGFGERRCSWLEEPV